LFVFQLSCRNVLVLDVAVNVNNDDDFQDGRFSKNATDFIDDDEHNYNYLMDCNSQGLDSKTNRKNLTQSCYGSTSALNNRGGSSRNTLSGSLFSTSSLYNKQNKFSTLTREAGQRLKSNLSKKVI
jgi:hypothetical protein